MDFRPAKTRKIHSRQGNRMSEKNIILRGQVYWLRATVRGKLIQESLRTSDVEIARQERDKRLAEIANWQWSDNRVVTFEIATADWVKHESDTISAQTARRYANSLETASAFFGEVNIASIDGRLISEFIKYRKTKGVTAATIRRDLTAISRVLEYSIEEEWRDDNPTLAKRRRLRERRDPIVLPVAEYIEAVIDAASPRFGALIRAAWLTGCRQNELVTATWRNFNPEKRTLTIVGKGNKLRVIALSAVAVELISAQPRDFGHDLIFCRSDGSAFKQAASDFTHVRRTVMAQRAKNGQPFVRFRFHDLRHLYAVEALRGGVNIYDLQKHLGHSSIKVTEMYLAHLTPEEAAKSQFGGVYAERLYTI